jgi:hypothetical protein
MTRWCAGRALPHPACEHVAHAGGQAVSTLHLVIGGGEAGILGGRGEVPHLDGCGEVMK